MCSILQQCFHMFPSMNHRSNPGSIYQAPAWLASTCGLTQLSISDRLRYDGKNKKTEKGTHKHIIQYKSILNIHCQNIKAIRNSQKNTPAHHQIAELSALSKQKHRFLSRQGQRLLPQLVQRPTICGLVAIMDKCHEVWIVLW